MAEIHPQGRDEPPVEAGHEGRDLSITRLVVFAAVLVALIAVVLAVMSALMGRFKAAEDVLSKDRPDRYAVKEEPSTGPKLQRNTTYDMAKFREKEQATLSSYGWVDPKAGVGRIPIERALELVAERGLPKPKAETKAKEGPSPRGPESSKK